MSDRDENRRSAEKIGESYSAGVEAMRRNLSPAHAAALDSLAELFRGSVAPEVAAFRTAFLRECGDSEPQVTIVGNEFAFTDRAALVLSRDHGIRTVAFAHGVFDWHYQHVGVLADHFVAWGSESARYALESGLTPGAKVLAVRPERPGLEARSAGRHSVTIFTQPVQFSRVPADGYREGILDLCARLAGRDMRVVIKPHPMERREDWRGIPGVQVLQPTDSAEDALRVSFAAVLLDSSVVVDCLRARVPAIGIGWCASTYGERMHRAGWLVNAPSPKDAFESIAGLRDVAPGSVKSPDAFEGHVESDGERLREALHVDPPKVRSARGRRHPEGVTDARIRSEAG